MTFGIWQFIDHTPRDEVHVLEFVDGYRHDHIRRVAKKNVAVPADLLDQVVAPGDAAGRRRADVGVAREISGPGHGIVVIEKGAVSTPDLRYRSLRRAVGQRDQIDTCVVRIANNQVRVEGVLPQLIAIIAILINEGDRRSSPSGGDLGDRGISAIAVVKRVDVPAGIQRDVRRIQEIGLRAERHRGHWTDRSRGHWADRRSDHRRHVRLGAGRKTQERRGCYCKQNHGRPAKRRSVERTRNNRL